MRANWVGVLVGGALLAAGVDGGPARAQAVGGGSPPPSYAAPTTPRPLTPGTFPSAVAPGLGAAPPRVVIPATPTPPAATGDGATLTSTAPAGAFTGTGTAARADLGTPVVTAPADGHPSYFRAELPPSPPSRLERMRQRVRDLIHRNHGNEGSDEHGYIDPSSGRTNLPISKPWLTPAR